MIKTLSQAEEFLYSFIPKDVQYKFPGDLGLKRTKYLLSLLRSPQEKIKVLHIAGTSGKGSTAFYLSHLLQAHGQKTGLHLSPHLLDIRERFQINNELISEELFCRYLNEVRPAIEKMQNSEFGNPTYFEVTVTLAYYIFYQENVNYAVIETGLGGLYDGTNVVENSSKVAIITRIGHDHTEILGKTLAKIAAQKAGIIHHKNIVITGTQHRNALGVIEAAANKMNSKLYIVNNKENVSHIKTADGHLFFSFKFLSTAIKNIELSTAAFYQVENASLALATLAYLSQRELFSVNEEKVRDTFKQEKFKGRMEIIQHKNKKLIIDGAHNPQKMAAFISSLKKQFPNKVFDFLIAVKKGKDYRDMLKQIAPVANTVTITQFSSKSQGFSLASESPAVLKKYLDKDSINTSIVDDPVKAYRTLLENSRNDIVVTGSLYLVAELYPEVILSR